MTESASDSPAFFSAGVRGYREYPIYYRSDGFPPYATSTRRRFRFKMGVPIVNQVEDIFKYLKERGEDLPRGLNIQDIVISFFSLFPHRVYLDLESTIEEQENKLGICSGKDLVLLPKPSILAQDWIKKLSSTRSGDDLQDVLSSLYHLFRRGQSLLEEFVKAEGIGCLVEKAEEDDDDRETRELTLWVLEDVVKNHQGRIKVISCQDALKWIYSMIKTRDDGWRRRALDVLLVLVELKGEVNPADCLCLADAFRKRDEANGCQPWTILMNFLKESVSSSGKYLASLCLINKILDGLNGTSTFDEVITSIEDQGMDTLIQDLGSSSNYSRIGDEVNLYQSIRERGCRGKELHELNCYVDLTVRFMPSPRQDFRSIQPEFIWVRYFETIRFGITFSCYFIRALSLSFQFHALYLVLLKVGNATPNCRRRNSLKAGEITTPGEKDQTNEDEITTASENAIQNQANFNSVSSFIFGAIMFVLCCGSKNRQVMAVFPGTSAICFITFFVRKSNQKWSELVHNGFAAKPSTNIYNSSAELMQAENSCTNQPNIAIIIDVKSNFVCDKKEGKQWSPRRTANSPYLILNRQLNGNISTKGKKSIESSGIENSRQPKRTLQTEANSLKTGERRDEPGDSEDSDGDGSGSIPPRRNRQKSSCPKGDGRVSLPRGKSSRDKINIGESTGEEGRITKISRSQEKSEFIDCESPVNSVPDGSEDDRNENDVQKSRRDDANMGSEAYLIARELNAFAVAGEEEQERGDKSNACQLAQALSDGEKGDNDINGATCAKGILEANTLVQVSGYGNGDGQIHPQEEARNDGHSTNAAPRTNLERMKTFPPCDDSSQKALDQTQNRVQENSRSPTEYKDESKMSANPEKSVNAADQKSCAELEEIDHNEASSREAVTFQEVAFSCLQKATNQFSKKIGEGSFGEVYVGQLDIKRKDTTVAVKKFKPPKPGKSKQSSARRKQFSSEIRAFMTCQHRNVVKLFAYCVDPELCLVYPYIDGGPLDEALLKTNPHPLSMSERLVIARDAADALKYLHNDCRLIHRDVKTSNLLLDDNKTVKLSDFGLSAYLNCKEEEEISSFYASQSVGTRCYMAPESFKGRVSKKVDVYAFGMVLYEIASGLPPYSSSKGTDLIMYMRDLREQNVNLAVMIDPRTRLSAEAEKASMELFDIAKQCSAMDRKARLEMNQVYDLLSNLFSAFENPHKDN